MDPSALVFLSSEEARRLAVAWQYLKAEDRSDRAWGDMAGLPALVVARHRPSLVASGICLQDGTTDDLALRYCGSVAGKAAGLRPRRGPNPEKRTASGEPPHTSGT